MDWWLVVAQLMGLVAGLYFGHYFGYRRGFKAGRKDHSEGMKMTWKFVADAIAGREKVN